MRDNELSANIDKFFDTTRQSLGLCQVGGTPFSPIFIYFINSHLINTRPRIFFCNLTVSSEGCSYYEVYMTLQRRGVSWTLKSK